VCNYHALPINKFPVHIGPHGSFDGPQFLLILTPCDFFHVGYSKKPEHVLQAKQQICQICNILNTDRSFVE
jgi:hypothetical protein